ncbi:MAG: lipoate--protein ligase family protein [Treponema sp.]|jgi:lipoate-protein ligase A|nr:lipoate--protein ligase family protein [Treponema sp.]
MTTWSTSLLQPPFPFRLINTGFHDGFYNMGLDEALLEGVSQGRSLPVLRLYSWKPPAVSVGYFQGLTEEVDVESCTRHGVDVVRRISGGGAVFHHEELTYSIIMPLGHPLAGETIQDSYQRICPGIIQGLACLGVSSRFAGINDILVEGRKISGNAQTRRMGCVLQHGTLLLASDVDLMFELLLVPQEKLKDKCIQDVRDRVTSLKALLSRDIAYEEVALAVAEGFRRGLSLDFIPIPLQEEEEARARELATGKFAAPQWLYSR